MLLAIDVGNTNIVYGLFELGPDKALIHQFRVETSRGRTADEYAVILRQLLAMRDVKASDVAVTLRVQQDAKLWGGGGECSNASDHSANIAHSDVIRG